MSKLPCEVVRDLFPSYIDELTNEVTNHLIEGHLEGCTDCQTVLASMKNPKAEPVDEKNNGEIDFLKKAKHKNRKKLWMAVALTVALVVGLFFIKNYFIGAIVPIEYVACQVEVKDNLLTIKGVIAAEQLSVSDIEIKETEGIVTIAFECVRRGLFNDNNFKETFTADRNISQVWLGNRILWANGESISAVTSAVYQTKHPYVGDMPANGSTAAALGIGVVLGDYK
ncbi:MAG: zf-HC2 domain-containing protein [Lachnospiraceae bacterium]|nr:zf-HC2 domain-containing protein [Lachnospiraceae bacterium]